jgi:hypothetical protein
MDHIHGKLLTEDGAKVLLEEIDGYMSSHPKRDGSKEYYGFFDVPPGKWKGADDKATYRLVLDDGRTGSIYADVHPCQQKGTLVAEFHVAGPLKA